MAAAILATMFPYMEADTTEHAPKWNFVVCGGLWSANVASFVPEVASPRGLLA